MVLAVTMRARVAVRCSVSRATETTFIAHENAETKSGIDDTTVKN